MRILSRHNVNFGSSEIRAMVAFFQKGGELEQVRKFEQAFCAHLGVRHAIATGNGRTALYLALACLELPAGSPVAMPAYTFPTLPEVVKALGLTPVFVPVDTQTFAVDPSRLETTLPPNTSALLIIHPFGQTAPMDAILEICKRRGIPLIEDPSQSIGARYRSKMAGAMGTASTFSLVQGKNMTACGGGMLTTDNDVLASRARALLETSGQPTDGWKRALSTIAQWALTSRRGFTLGLFGPFLVLNHLDRPRLDALFEEPVIPFDPSSDVQLLSGIQAAIGLVQLERLDILNAVRRKNATALLNALEGIEGLELPRVVEFCTPTFNAVAVRTPRATHFRQDLLKLGIDSREDYMRWYGTNRSKRDEILYLPNHPGLNLDDMAYVAKAVRRIARARLAR